MMNARTNLIRRNDLERRGAVIPLVGFMLVALFGTIAFVADIGNIIVVRTTLTAAADAAALAGAGAMAQSYSFEDVKAEAVDYGQYRNVPANYGSVMDGGSVTLGTWDPETRTFSPGGSDPSAVRVVAERSNARGNAVPYFFGRIFGLTSTEVRAEAVAVGAISNDATEDHSVYVTSTKDLSNVVLEFEDGVHQKFDNLNRYTGTFQGTGQNEGKPIARVWIKSGCNHSDDGPGYGHRIDNPDDGSTVHGPKEQGCDPKVTATFQASGIQFTTSGAASPVRLVK